MKKKDIQISILNELTLSNKGKDNLKNYLKSIDSEEIITDIDFQYIAQIEVLELFSQWGCDCDLTQNDRVEIDNMIVSLHKKLV